MKCYNRVKTDGMEALCIYLNRFAYFCRYSDIMSRFARATPQLSMISNLVMNFIYENCEHHLENWGQDLLSPLNLQLCANSIHAEGELLNNCWGFIDGTLNPTCRPREILQEPATEAFTPFLTKILTT